jgi:hypothetical protein
MRRPTLEHIATLPLRHTGDCNLVGVSPDLTVYVEEIYSADGWMAQHALTLDGSIVESVDEDFGGKTDLKPLLLPTNSQRPQTGWHTMRLNFSGPRHRGLRGPERTPDLVRPLTLPEKLLLIEHFHLPVESPQLMGLAESYVLAEAPLAIPDVFVVCRRVRLAIHLYEEQVDVDNQRYDYDTIVVYMAHFYDRADDEPSLHESLVGLGAVRLRRPMDCLVAFDHLFIADGGTEDHPSVVHVWRITYPNTSASGDISY